MNISDNNGVKSGNDITWDWWLMQYIKLNNSILNPLNSISKFYKKNQEKNVIDTDTCDGAINGFLIWTIINQTIKMGAYQVWF